MLVLAALNDPTVTMLALVGLLLGVYLMARGIKPDTGSAPPRAAPPPAERGAAPVSRVEAIRVEEPPSAATPFRQGRIKLGAGPSALAATDATPPDLAPAAPAESPSAEEPFRQGRIKLRGPSMFAAADAAQADPAPAAPAEESAPTTTPFHHGRIKLRGGASTAEPAPPAPAAPSAPPKPAGAEEPAAPPEPAAAPEPPAPPEPAAAPAQTAPPIAERGTVGHGTIRLRKRGPSWR